MVTKGERRFGDLLPILAPMAIWPAGTTRCVQRTSGRRALWLSAFIIHGAIAAFPAAEIAMAPRGS